MQAIWAEFVQSCIRTLTHAVWPKLLQTLRILLVWFGHSLLWQALWHSCCHIHGLEHVKHWISYASWVSLYFASPCKHGDQAQRLKKISFTPLLIRQTSWQQRSVKCAHQRSSDINKSMPPCQKFRRPTCPSHWDGHQSRSIWYASLQYTSVGKRSEQIHYHTSGCYCLLDFWPSCDPLRL